MLSRSSPTYSINRRQRELLENSGQHDLVNGHRFYVELSSSVSRVGSNGRIGMHAGLLLDLSYNVRLQRQQQ